MMGIYQGHLHFNVHIGVIHASVSNVRLLWLFEIVYTSDICQPYGYIRGSRGLSKLTMYTKELFFSQTPHI